MGIVFWIVLGLVAVLAVWWILPERDPAGLVLTALICVGVSILSGWIATQAGFGSVTSVQLGSATIVLLAALVLRMMLRLVRIHGG
jgi:uncharacterized membrane protein YeaQ/YmgE (transglycosylase-associated protein family)